jgi:hypothetical protein
VCGIASQKKAAILQFQPAFGALLNQIIGNNSGDEVSDVRKEH